MTAAAGAGSGSVAGTLAQGALAGGIATVAMSGVMLAGGQLVGRQPPEAIVEQAVSRTTGTPPPRDVTRLLAAAAHLGFGAALGAAYALLPRRVPGVAVSLAVWALSYEGWVPALGALPRASRDEPGRPAVMVAAHVVHGAVMQALAPEAVTPRRPRRRRRRR